MLNLKSIDQTQRGNAMKASDALRGLAAVAMIVGAFGATARSDEPEIIRGQITAVEGDAIIVKNGVTSYRLGIPENAAVLVLSEGSFTKVEYGVYVGAVAVKMDAYSPIVRDSLSWLHQGYELRIIDEELRGIASGHKPWNLTNETIIAHGWVDDIEGRVLSIKYGPTEAEETDVEIARDRPVLRMSLGSRSLIVPSAHITAGGQKDEKGNFVAAFVFVGKDGIVPPL